MALVNDRTGFARRLRGVVRAVIGNDKNIYKFFRIFLKFDAFDKTADNVAFVSCGDDERKMMQFWCVFKFPLIFEYAYSDINKLVRIKQKEKEKYKEIEYSDKGFQNIALPKVSAKWDCFCSITV